MAPITTVGAALRTALSIVAWRGPRGIPRTAPSPGDSGTRSDHTSGIGSRARVLERRLCRRSFPSSRSPGTRGRVPATSAGPVGWGVVYVPRCRCTSRPQRQRGAPAPGPGAGRWDIIEGHPAATSSRAVLEAQSVPRKKKSPVQETSTRRLALSSSMRNRTT